MKMVAFPNSGKELISVETCRLMLGLAFRVLKGLSTLKMRRAFRLIPRLSNSIDLKVPLYNSVILTQ